MFLPCPALTTPPHTPQPKRPPSPNNSSPNLAFRSEPGPHGRIRPQRRATPHPHHQRCFTRRPRMGQNKELTPRAPPPVAELPGPRPHGPIPELSSPAKVPQTPFAGGSSRLGWAPRDPPATACGLHSTRSGQPCRGTGCSRRGSKVPGPGRRSIFSNHLPENCQVSAAASAAQRRRC